MTAISASRTRDLSESTKQRRSESCDHLQKIKFRVSLGIYELKAEKFVKSEV